MKRKFETPEVQPNPVLNKLFNEYFNDDSDKSKEELLIEYLDPENASAFFNNLLDENTIETFDSFNQWNPLNDFLKLVSELGYLHIVKPAIDYLVFVEYEELHVVITDSILAAAYNAHFEIVTYLLQYVEINFQYCYEELVNETFQVFARTGEIKALQFYMDSNFPIDLSEAIYAASVSGLLFKNEQPGIGYISTQIKAIKLIASNNKTILNMEDINDAVKESENIDVVRFLIEELGANPTAGDNQCLRNAWIRKNTSLVLYLASFPTVLQSLDAEHQRHVTFLKNGYKTLYYDNFNKYKTNHCMFFSHFSKLYEQNRDVQATIAHLGSALIQKDSGLNDQALEFVLK